MKGYIMQQGSAILRAMTADGSAGFYENYLLLKDKNNGFRRKGGLFTEFTNKNIGSINVNKREIKERLKKEKNIKKFFKTANNSLIS